MDISMELFKCSNVQRILRKPSLDASAAPTAPRQIQRPRSSGPIAYRGPTGGKGPLSAISGFSADLEP